MQSAVRMQTVSGNYIVAGWSNSKHILSNDGGTAGGVAVGAGANDGSWHHVAMTWQRNTVNGFKSYLDGTLVQQINSANVALPSFSTDVYLGAFSGTSEFTNGTLDEVRVWTVARTQTQIQLGQYTCSPADQTGLLMFYRFNQGAVNSANVGITGLLNGTSSNDLHGVLTNFDLTTTTNWVTGFPLSVGISIVTSPTLSGSQCVGNTPTLTAKATSNGLTIVTWQYKAAGASNYTDIETRAYTSNTDVTYTIPPLSITDNGAMYRAVFKGFCGAVVTDAVTVTFGPTRLYVKANATGSNTGLDWTNAFTDLQSALNYACSGALTEIWVAKGTYKPSSTGNRTTSFVLLPNVKIYGSFAGNEASLSQRTPSVRTANTSILSGDLLDNDVISGSGISLSITGNDENSRVVILNNFTSTNPLTSAAMLDGFTISGGNADGVVADYQGGGMYNNYASPSLNNLTFSGNNAGFQGGGMHNPTFPTEISIKSNLA